MWCVSTDCLLGFLNRGGSRRSSDPNLLGFLDQSGSKKNSDPAQYYHKLKFILQTLKEFFYADGNGLTEYDLETSNFKVCFL